MSLMQPLQSGQMLDMIRERDEALAELDRGGRPGVTVAVPVYEDYSYLDATLASISAQTVAPLEILVINDGSGVGATRHIQILAERHWAQHIRITNRGLAAARNAALMIAKGEAFLPIDADDRIDPRYIEKTLPLLTPDVDVVLTGIQEHGPHRNSCYEPGYDRPWQAVTVELLISDFNRFFYCSLFRTATLREIGGYNTRMDGGWQRGAGGFEDYTTWIDLMKRGKKFAACLEPLFWYTTRADSMLARAMGNREALMAEIRRHHA